MRLPIIVAGILAFLYVKNNDKKGLLGIFVYMAMFYLFIERKNIMLSVALPLILMGLNELKFTVKQGWIKYIGATSFELYLAHVIPMNFAGRYDILVGLAIMSGGTVVLAFLYHVLNKGIAKLRIAK